MQGEKSDGMHGLAGRREGMEEGAGGVRRIARVASP